MGTLWSDLDRSGLIVNGVLLGVPAAQDQTPMFRWDDGACPNGEVLADGTVVPDEQPEPF